MTPPRPANRPVCPHRQCLHRTVCARQVRALQSGIAQVCIVQYRLRQVGRREVGKPEVGPDMSVPARPCSDRSAPSRSAPRWLGGWMTEPGTQPGTSTALPLSVTSMPTPAVSAPKIGVLQVCLLPTPCRNRPPFSECRSRYADTAMSQQARAMTTCFGPPYWTWFAIGRMVKSRRASGLQAARRRIRVAAAWSGPGAPKSRIDAWFAQTGFLGLSGRSSTRPGSGMRPGSTGGQAA